APPPIHTPSLHDALPISPPTPPYVRVIPANRTGARVDCLPVRAAFPSCGEGRRSHRYIRGLLRLYSRYGPRDLSRHVAAFVTRRSEEHTSELQSHLNLVC